MMGKSCCNERPSIYQYMTMIYVFLWVFKITMDYSYGSWSVWLEGKATGHTMVTQPHVVPVIASDSLCWSYRCMKSVSNMSKKSISCVLERKSWKICTWWCSSTSNLRRYMMVHGQTMVGILSQRHGGYSHRAMDYTQFVSSQSCTQVAAVLVLGHLGWRRGQCSKRWPQELRSESLGESWPLDHGYWEGLITHRWFGRSEWICVLSMFVIVPAIGAVILKLSELARCWQLGSVLHNITSCWASCCLMFICWMSWELYRIWGKRNVIGVEFCFLVAFVDSIMSLWLYEMGK